MTDQFNRAKRRKILNKVSDTIDKWDNANTKITEAIERAEEAEKEIERLRRELDDLKEFAYERAPKLAAETTSRQIAELHGEIGRLRQALDFIASLESGSRGAHSKFAEAQNRARHALGLKPGELTIRKS